MTGNIVAQRYSQALFSIANNQGMPVVEHCADVLESLAAAFVQSTDLQRVLRAPVITVAEKERVILALLQKFDAQPLMVRFCKLLAERDRLAILPSISAAFISLFDVARGLVRGHITTAIPLDGQEQQALLKALSAKSSRTLQLNFDVNADLLGGIVLQIGDIVLDASLQAQLVQLKDTMTQIDN